MDNNELPIVVFDADEVLEFQFEVSVENPLDLAQHYGMIVKYAIKYWRKLPPRYKAMYSPEDMISFGHLTVLRKFKQFEPRKKVKFCTWMTTCLENAFLDMLHGSMAQKRKAVECELDSQFRPPAFEIQESLALMERWSKVWGHSSKDLQLFFEALITGADPAMSPTQSIVEEIRHWTRIYKFSFEDMRSVLRGFSSIPSQLGEK